PRPRHADAGRPRARLQGAPGLAEPQDPAWPRRDPRRISLQPEPDQAPARGIHRLAAQSARRRRRPGALSGDRGPMKTADTRGFVLAYLEGKGKIPGATPEEKLGHRYLDSGLIDSFGLVEMIAELEREFAIRFEPRD